MAKKSRPTFQKREKEKARVQKQKDKETRRLEAKERKAEVTAGLGGEDPDIAGIRPGPQPLPEQWDQAHPRWRELEPEMPDQTAAWPRFTHRDG